VKEDKGKDRRNDQAEDDEEQDWPGATAPVSDRMWGRRFHTL